MSTFSLTFNGRNWLRFAQIVVLKSSNDAAIDLSNLRIRFEVRADDSSSLNTLAVRVYNPSQQTAKTIINEFDRVVLAAGYIEGMRGNVFDGTITQFKYGRERNTDNYLDIFAADGDFARNFATVNASRPAGTTDNQSLADLASAMGVPVAKDADGFLQTGGIFPRGKVLWGMARDYVHTIAKKNACRWSIQNGVLTLVPNAGYLTGNEIVELNSASGMLGMPEQTENGIAISCYLNPQIQVGQLVRINNADINQAARRGLVFYPSYSSQYYPASTSADGLYRVLVVEHTGDIRGSEWRSDLTCLAVDSSSKSVPTN